MVSSVLEPFIACIGLWNINWSCLEGIGYMVWNSEVRSEKEIVCHFMPAHNWRSDYEWMKVSKERMCFEKHA